MSHVSYRPVLTLVLLATGLGAGCTSDQKVASAPVSAPPAEPPAEPLPQQPAGDAAPSPNGEPVTTPPAAPPPQGIADTANNTLATPGSSDTQATLPPLSEAQVAMITELANASEIEHGKLAQTKAQSPSVKKFAAMMVKHHTDAKAEQSRLYQALKLTATQSSQSNQLKDGADKTLGALRAADDLAFDSLYMDRQVEAHQKVLEAIDKQLLPAASDQRLIAALKKMRTTVEAHLTEARSVQAVLQASSSR